MNDTNIHLKKTEVADFHAEVSANDTHLQKETVVVACQSSYQMQPVNTHDEDVKSESSIFSKPAATAKHKVSAPKIGTGSDGRKTLQSTHVVETAASSTLTITDNHRCLPVKRCAPKETLDPLFTFMMLRADQAAPVIATQSLTNTPGRLLLC